MYDFLNKITYHTTVKHRKTAICGCHRTVVSLDFGSTALLWYGQHLYSAVFCTAITVYSMLESPIHMIQFSKLLVKKAPGMPNITSADKNTGG
jgi:hypothetical protein